MVVTLVLFGSGQPGSQGDLTVGREGRTPLDLVIDLPEEGCGGRGDLA